MNVYTFSNFGYEGHLVQVETDLRKGEPSTDIIGISDSMVTEVKERLINSFVRSNIDYPEDRVLISLSPSDLRKDNNMSFAMAMSIIAKQEKLAENNTLVLGEIERNGDITSTNGEIAAVNTAKASGINNVICNEKTAEIIKNIPDIKILTANNLHEAKEKAQNEKNFIKTNPQQNKNSKTVEFEEFDDEDIKSTNEYMKKHFTTARALEIAAAGKHNILLTGRPGCGKTILTTKVLPQITPKLTYEEALPVNRIYSLAGLSSPSNTTNRKTPFRMPHQTATIEGMCGGGPNCRPGEISLAHNGTLFLDEAGEFRTTCLQLLRVPLESQSITLSRAGRTTVYPANFQLAIATNPCPCGNFGSEDKICLDSAKSIELYWKKFSDPLLDRIEIKNFCKPEENNNNIITIEKMRNEVEKAFDIQRTHGKYNSKLTPLEIADRCKLDKQSSSYLDKRIEKQSFTPREINNILKVSLTIANMEGRENIQLKDLQESIEMCSKVFDKPNQFKYENNEIENKTEQFNKNFEKIAEKENKPALDFAQLTAGLNDTQINELFEKMQKESEILRSQNKSNENIEINTDTNKKNTGRK